MRTSILAIVVLLGCNNEYYSIVQFDAGVSAPGGSTAAGSSLDASLERNANDTASGSGGNTGRGGASTGQGGLTSTGGTSAVGGFTSRGGTSQGGFVSAGGFTSRGGISQGGSVSAGGATSVGGFTDRGGATSAGGSLQTSCTAGLSDGCTACVRSKCVDQCTACETNPDCMILLTCLNDCLDQGKSQDECTSQCIPVAPGGVGVALQYRSCANSQCTNQCNEGAGGQDAGTGGSGAGPNNTCRDGSWQCKVTNHINPSTLAAEPFSCACVDHQVEEVPGYVHKCDFISLGGSMCCMSWQRSDTNGCFSLCSCSPIGSNDSCDSRAASMNAGEDHNARVVLTCPPLAS